MPCPICDRATDPGYRPFCSRRCADVDLVRWMRGEYRLETDETPEDAPAARAPRRDEPGD
jgi:hypothetical protein